MKFELVANAVISGDGLACNDGKDKCGHHQDDGKSVVGWCKLFDSTLHKNTDGSSIRCALCTRFVTRKV